MAPRITRAASAVVLGLALTATPVFAVAAEQPSTTAAATTQEAATTEAAQSATTAATTAAATTQAASSASATQQATAAADNGATDAAQPAAVAAGTVQVTGGGKQFIDAVKSGASTIELTGNGEDGNGLFNFFYTNVFGTHKYSATSGTTPESVNINHDVTIVNKTGNSYAYLYGIEFNVADGAKLTFQDVNVNDARNVGSPFNAVKPITVQPGGSFETKGTGDIVTDNGRGEGYAIKLVSSSEASKPATAVLGAAPSGFMAKVEGSTGWAEDNKGNYGGSYCVTAGTNSKLTITDGRFTAENAKHQAIQSYGTVVIDPTDDASFNAYGNADDLGTVRIDGTNNGQPTGAKLVAHDTQFGYIAPGGRANVGDVEIKATLQLEGAAKAYLTDSAVSTISDSKVGELPAVYLDTAANLYEQETTESNGPASYSTNFDTPSFANIKSEYVGDYLTSGQYKASAHFDSQNAVSESVTDASKSRGLWKLDDQASVDDLEKLVAAKADKLTDGATESASDPSDAAQGATVTANLPLGKSQVYGKYEIAKNDGTSIKGDGHAYAYSPVHDLQAGWDVSAYRAKGTFTAPEAGATSGIGGDVAPEGYVFAGWYTQGGDLRTGEPNNSDKFTSGIEGIKALSKPGLDSYAAQHVLAKDVKSGYAYAKFIPASLVDAKAQYKTEGASSAVRFLGAVESYNYNGMAFDVTQYDADGKQLGSKSFTTTTAYDYVLANVNGQEDQKQYGTDIFKATAYGSKDQLPLLITRAYWKGLGPSFNGKFKVTASLTTPDGTVVKGPAKTFIVNNGKVTADNQ
ncbi:hypothetical protein [Olsenella uli]|uniref:hypothetical protein n=1 Tax=Olsenella uli TaxID=133926 RepID=UPI0012ABAEED|nr:hypothetical protein [Olsenella uli]